MKIIYIANVRLPTEKAHGIQIMKMCEEFKKAGEDITLIVSSRGEGDPFEFYGIETVFPIERINVPDLTGKIPYLGFLIDYLFFIWGAKKFLNIQNFDILYSRDHPLFLRFFRKWKDKIVFEFHHLHWSVNHYLNGLKEIKAIIAITWGIKKDLVKFGVDANKILVAPDGVDAQKFQVPSSKLQIRERLNLPLDKKIVMYAGSSSLYSWKGTDVLIEAAKFLPEDFLVYLVGEREKEIENIMSNVLLIERKPHKEIPLWLKAADVLILPNKKGDEISEKYTSPLKLFEYMASGNPIVASDLPSIREILNENNAVLVEPNNPEKLAEGIKKVLDNRDLADKISNQAFFDVQDYTWQKRVDKILRFINE